MALSCFDGLVVRHRGECQDRSFQRDGTQGAKDSRDGLSLVGRRPQWERRRGFNHSIHRQQRISSSVALDGLGNPPRAENRGDRSRGPVFGTNFCAGAYACRSEVGKPTRAGGNDTLVP